MRHGAKRLLPLLAAVAMVCSSAAVSASAADDVTDAEISASENERDALPTVTLNSGQTQTKYIFANSEFNSPDRMPEAADAITGIYNGKEVELIPDWKKPEGLFNGLKGRQDNGSNGRFDANKFTAATFTVKDTGEHVQAALGQTVILNVWVIAVDAMLSCDGYNDGKISVAKSQALAVQSGEDLQRLLNLPTQAKVTYQPEQVKTGTEDLTKKTQAAKPFRQAGGSYKITGWEIASYNGLNLNAERLRNLAGEVTAADAKTVTLWANCENLPEWAVVKRGDMSFSLTITPDSKADVTVTPPGDITYGQSLGTPSATAAVNGRPVPDAAFTFTYEGIEGTVYSENTIPPTDAGKYKVTAALTTLGYSGSAAAEFTIAKAGSVTADAYISVPNGGTETIKIDETFIPSGMAKGAKIKEAPVIPTEGKPIESYTAQAGAAQLTLKSKSDAQSGSFQKFFLVLESENYEVITVKVTVCNDNVVVDGAKLKGRKTEFESGAALREIVDLSGCSATVNGSAAAGRFALLEPVLKLEGPDIYKDWSVSVLFTADGGTTYRVMVSVPNFTVKAPEGSDEDPDDVYLNNGYFITIYANSEHNQSKEALLELVQKRKGSYTFSGKTYKAAWGADEGNPDFNPKGYAENVWYQYTAALDGRSEKPKAYVRVIPVNAAPSTLTSSKTIKTADVNALREQDWKGVLNLPSTVIFKNEPAQKVDYQDKRDEFLIQDQQSGCAITGWKMDGRDLTLAALRSKAAGAVNGDVAVTLTPVYHTPAWITVKGEIPTFQLTIAPKIPVNVKWDGPASPIIYREALNLGTPAQVEKDGGSIDETGSFTWDYVYYKADGATRLEQQPADVGTYKVRAILNSSSHSGASALKEFEIKAKSIDGLTFALPADMSLTYNKRPQAPVDGNVTNGDKPAASDEPAVLKEPAILRKPDALTKLTAPYKPADPEGSIVPEKSVSSDKPITPDKPADDISWRKDEINWILDLVILVVCGIGMIVVLRDKRRKYREKLCRR